MTAVTVTADDFGLCPEIDEAICLLHDRGIVNRTSLLVNTPRFEASVAALRSRPGLEVAIHLNLTDGPPLLPVEQVRTLVDASGCFAGGRHYGIIAGILVGRISRQEIHREWRAQIAKARGAGVTIRELNGHGHLHLLPPLHGIVLDLQREFVIPQIRLVRSREWPRGVLLHLCSLELRRRLRRHGVLAAFPDRTLGLRTPGDIDRRIRLDDLTHAGDRTIELIVHPAAGANPYHERWGYRGEEVLNWLLASSDMR